MKVARGAIVRALERLDPNHRFYLFHGSDDGQSRSHAQRLLASLGASRFVIAGGSVKADPALLAAEAGAMTLFGGPRLIWVDPAGEEIVEGVAALLAAPGTESLVVAIAGSLKKSSALLKLAEASPAALSYVSYTPEGQDAERMVAEVGRTLGLKISPPIAARIASACANNQAVVRQELEKLALYVGSSTAAPKELNHESVDAVGADLPEGDYTRLSDLALSGKVGEVAAELASLTGGGGEAIPILRSLQRRVLMLAPARARVERGESHAAVMAAIDKSLFYKDKLLVGSLLQRWDASTLASVMDRSGKVERDGMLTPVPPVEALAEELIAIARVGRRR